MLALLAGPSTTWNSSFACEKLTEAIELVGLLLPIDRASLDSASSNVPCSVTVSRFYV